MTLGKTQRKVLNHLEEVCAQQTTGEIQEALNMTQDQCLNALRRLYERGLVLRVDRAGEFVWTVTPQDMIKENNPAT